MKAGQVRPNNFQVNHSARYTSIHVLFQCPENRDRRSELWEGIRASCPPALYHEIMNMTIDIRMSFILSGLNNSFIPEWQSLFSACLQFINSLYVERLHAKIMLHNDDSM